MFNIPLLDAAIAMAFVYLLLSLVVSGLAEFINMFQRNRSKTLHKAITEVFDDRLNKNWAEMIYEHPMVDRLKETDKQLPSYISAAVFADVLINLIGDEGADIQFKKEQDGRITFTENRNPDAYIAFKEGIKKLNESDVKKLLRVFADNSGNLESLRTRIENWYNDYMDRVSGWFKKKSKRIVFYTALSLSILLNVDSIKIFTSVSNDAGLRDAIVASAVTSLEKQMKEKTNANINSKNAVDIINDINQAYSRLEILDLPIGWSCSEAIRQNKNTNLYCCLKEELSHKLFFKLLGWLFTTVMLSFGAPFWFDALNKIVGFRSSGAKPLTNVSK